MGDDLWSRERELTAVIHRAPTSIAEFQGVSHRQKESPHPKPHRAASGTSTAYTFPSFAVAYTFWPFGEYAAE